MKIFYKTLFFIFLSIVSVNSQNDELAEIKSNIEFLANESLEGRFPGTDGEMQAAKYIASKYEEYGLLKIEDTYFQNFSFILPTSPHEEVKFNQDSNSKINATNVVGYIDNKSNFTVIIGAHYDHIGYGGQYSLDRGVNEIHNGADDNASGTSMLINLAKKLKQRNNSRYNYLFIAFSAEELGLLGSKYFVDSSLFNQSSYNYMINLDMVGRLNESKELSIFGVGTSSIFRQVINSLNEEFKLNLVNDGTGPSDHTSFYNKELPVLFFHTGSHENYHRPTDDVEYINYQGIEQISNYVYNIIEELEAYEKLDFKETISNQQSVARFNVSLRVMPDYVFDGDGMKADQIIKGGPADLAGLLDGDIIIQIDELKVNDVYSYMEALSKYNEGDTIKVLVIRETKKLEFEVQL